MARSCTLALVALAIGLFTFGAASAQTTEFTYQGSLKDGSNPATGSYDFEFTLFGSVGGADQVGPTLVRNAVAVTGGTFTVLLDFGNQFPGAARFLQIRVRPAGVGAFTSLAPRQPISSTPYAVKSLSADTATNATQLGGVASNQYVLTGDLRLSDARNPLPNSPNYIQNQNAGPQAGANFNISGTGTAGNLTTGGSLNVVGSAPPPLSPAGQGRIYFDSATNKVKVSENGSAFTNLVGATGVSGSGTVNTVPLWTGSTLLGNSQITQSAAGVQLPNLVQLAPGTQGNQIFFGSPNGETGITFTGSAAATRADIRYGPTNANPNITALKLVAGPAGGPPAETNGIVITPAGNVGIGIADPISRLAVIGNPANNFALNVQHNRGDQAAALFATNANVGGYAGYFDGNLRLVNGYFTLGFTSLTGQSQIQLCRDVLGQVGDCSSSERYKTNVQTFTAGLDLVRRLRPVTFRWKGDGKLDLGLIAEDVAEVEPLLASHNDKGEIEGVKYDRLGALFINAFNEQQALIGGQTMQLDQQARQLNEQQRQIQQQQTAINELRTLVCRRHSRSAVCRASK